MTGRKAAIFTRRDIFYDCTRRNDKKTLSYCEILQEACIIQPWPIFVCAFESGTCIFFGLKKLQSHPDWSRLGV